MCKTRLRENTQTEVSRVLSSRREQELVSTGTNDVTKSVPSRQEQELKFCPTAKEEFMYVVSRRGGDQSEHVCNYCEG